MLRNRRALAGLFLALTAIAAVAITEQFIKPGYVIKSVIKLVCFSGAIILYSVISQKKAADVIFLRPLSNPRPLIFSVLFCFFGMGLAFLIFRSQLDLANIRDNLMAKENLTKENCLYVFTYIIVVNSFLEEAFFRGFTAHLFENRKLSFSLSAVLFALYHIGIVASWFNPLIFLVCIGGLALVGLFLQWLAESFGTLKASWIAHASANVAINIIGALLIFGILR
ncbi:MAG: CPBP family intramembrane metalloprotease [Erysipelotrichaceae bacterium]|nr:CPBP family intramembrane metalloprotease [Erysipelotrichaceae bacterium]